MEEPLKWRQVYPQPEIHFLNITARSYNCLAKAHIWSVAEIHAMSDDDLMRLPFFGRKCLGEVREAVREFEEHRALRPSGWPQQS